MFQSEQRHIILVLFIRFDPYNMKNMQTDKINKEVTIRANDTGFARRTARRVDEAVLRRGGQLYPCNYIFHTSYENHFVAGYPLDTPEWNQDG